MTDHPHTVLIVDDDEDIRDILREVLTDEGFSVEMARDGQEGLDRLRSGVFCLVLLDLMMPRKDGWAFRAEQQLDPLIRDVPVVVITASGAARLELLGGIKAVLHKPMSYDAILTTVRAHC